MRIVPVATREGSNPPTVLSVAVWLHVFSGVYGDVQRVKILFNKKENALVQMSDATQAQLGQTFALRLPFKRNICCCGVFINSLPVSFFQNLFPISDESSERPASPRQRDPSDVVQTSSCAAASGRGGPRGAGADAGFLRLCPPPLQKTWL